MGMDSERLNREGAAFAPFHRQNHAIETGRLHGVIVVASQRHMQFLFATGVGADSKDSDRNIMHIGEV